MYLINDTTVYAVLSIAVVPAMYDSTSTILAGMIAVALHTLEALPFSYVFGMLFISSCSPIVDQAGHTFAFFYSVLMSLY